MYSAIGVLTAMAALTGPGQAGQALSAPTPVAVPLPTPVSSGDFAPPLPSGDFAPSIEPPASSRSDRVELQRCLVKLIDDMEIPAQVDGVLAELEAREGMHVKAGTQLGRIDDRQAKAKKKVAQAEMIKAREQAANDVNVVYAEAATAVAQAELDHGAAANRRYDGAVKPSEMRRRRLSRDKARLQIKQAKYEQSIAGHTVVARAAEVEVTDVEINRRKITAVGDGMIVEVKKQQGAWVTAGEPVLRVVRMDRLRVAGHVSAARYGPQEIDGRPVEVVVQLERGRVERFPGKVTFINPLQSGGDYSVWAEVANRTQNGQWVLRPGLHANMTIHLDSAAASAR